MTHSQGAKTTGNSKYLREGPDIELIIKAVGKRFMNCRNSSLDELNSRLEVTEELMNKVRSIKMSSPRNTEKKGRMSPDSCDTRSEPRDLQWVSRAEEVERKTEKLKHCLKISTIKNKETHNTPYLHTA